MAARGMSLALQKSHISAGTTQTRRLATAPSATLPYDISAYSSYSANYHPRNIMVNRPADQSSRWSSGSNNHLQFISLRLDSPAVVQTITFGKYHKLHVCNLKEFKVFGGMSPDNMIELLHSGLRNDSEPETFALKHKANGVIFPCQYIKIVPLLAWGANFNFSIWYVELHGIADPEIVESIYWDYVNYRETEVIRLCLKHFRQRNFLEPFRVLQERTQIQLEDSLLTDLHRELVVKGNFDVAESLLTRAASRALFEDYISSCDYKPVWRRIMPSDPDAPIPGMRGGHQMCVDNENGIIYMFGGWDGSRDLSDFWSFNIASDQWTCISLDTRKQSGPGPRSCHKICFDQKKNSIYVLGKYVDPDSRPNIPLDSDFWRYDISASRWTRISANTAQDGGPELIYDHQMVVDSDRQILYVFGGRTIGPDVTQTVYSGLYSYNIAMNQWTLVRTDTSQPENTIQLKSRIGHSMLLNPKTRELYVFAGQRNKDYFSDFYAYELDTDTVREISRDYSKHGGPEAGFTQRATIDIDLDEFYVLSGLTRDKNATQDTVRNAFWVYSIRRNKWTRVYQNENMAAEYWAKMGDREPRPRFAHQLVYDAQRKRQYMFGGNPGEPGSPNLRLDDFWELKLVRPKPEDVLRRARFLVRRQRFREMCMAATASTSASPAASTPSLSASGYSASGSHLGSATSAITPQALAALGYLQTHVSQMVDHTDPVESKSFRELTTHLFKWSASALSSQSTLMALNGMTVKLTSPASAGVASMISSAAPGSLAVGGMYGGMDVFGAGPTNSSVSGHRSSTESPVSASSSISVVSGGMATTPQPTNAHDSISKDTYLLRTELYESLLAFFPEQMREPRSNLVDLVAME